MKLLTDRSSWTRRTFLKALGVTAGAAVSPNLRPMLREADAKMPPATGQTAKVGLLVPQSSAHPDLGRHFLAGLHLSFRQAQRPLDLATAAIGFGPGVIHEQAQKLMEGHGADLLVAVTSPTVAAQLRPLLEQYRTPLVVADAGANTPRAGEASDYIYYSSLGYWQANWSMGRWAAANLGPKGYLVGSFYESGYDSLDAFRLGAEAAGGHLTAVQITHVPPTPVNWSALVEAIRASQPDYVAAVYSGPEASEFLDAYARSGLTFPLVGSAFLMGEQPLATVAASSPAFRSVLGWAPSLETPENLAFTAGYRATEGREADPFALLGYDTGLLLLTALQAAGGDTRSAGFRTALAGARFTSPRGPVAMSPVTHSLSSPLYLRSVYEGGRAAIAKLDPVNELAPGLRALRSTERTGWLNGYLLV